MPDDNANSRWNFEVKTVLFVKPTVIAVSSIEKADCPTRILLNCGYH